MIESLSPEKLNQLAKDFVAGRVFSDRHCPPDMWTSVFMILGLGDAEVVKGDIDDLGMVYEYLDQAGPMTVNGYPTFFSFRMLNKADAMKLFEKADALEKAAAAALAAT